MKLRKVYIYTYIIIKQVRTWKAMHLNKPEESRATPPVYILSSGANELALSSQSGTPWTSLVYLPLWNSRCPAADYPRKRCRSRPSPSRHPPIRVRFHVSPPDLDIVALQLLCLHEVFVLLFVLSRVACPCLTPVPSCSPRTPAPCLW